MKLIITAILAGAASMGMNTSMADTVTLDTTAGYYPGLGGGEFTARTAAQSFLGFYNTGAVVNGGFETFCIETGVEFNPGVTYYYTLGSVSQPSPGSAGSGSGLALSAGAAWLYYHFAVAGSTLAGFDYTPGPGRQADANLVQAAIWAFQGGQSYGNYPVPTTANNLFYAEAVAALGGLAAADSPYGGSSVAILQMWSNPDDTGPAQNQLVLTDPPSVPDGGMSAGLMGSALVLLRGLSGKRFGRVIGFY